MLELDFPISCDCCTKPIYGPLVYCPFCGKQFVVIEKDETSQKEARPAIQEAIEPIPLPPYQPEIESFKSEDGEVESPPEEVTQFPREASLSEAPAANLSSKSGLSVRKWAVACCIILALILAIFFYLKPTTPPHHTSPPSPNDCISGKSIAADVMGKGVQLSILINKIAAQETVLNAAKKLSSISDRYASQTADAEKKLQHSQETCKVTFNAYRETIGRLCQLKPDCISSALAQLQNEQPSDREKLVMSLVASHVQLFDNDGKLRQEQIMADFKKNFLSFSE